MVMMEVSKLLEEINSQSDRVKDLGVVYIKDVYGDLREVESVYIDKDGDLIIDVRRFLNGDRD